MSLNYAEKWSPELIKIHEQESLISPFINTNIEMVGAKKFHFTQMSTSGFKNHARSGGWNKGTFSQNDTVYEFTHDRDIQFLVDKADVDETNATASIKNISMVFERTQAMPESDAYFFSSVAAKAVAKGMSSSTALSSYTKDNVLTKLKSHISKVKRYRPSLFVYVRSEIMDLLEMSTEISKTIVVTSLAENGNGAAIETRVATIDGVPVVEILDDERFYSKFDYTEGFTPATGSFAINVLCASLETVKFVPKFSSIYYFAPGEHTEGDGYLYQNRQLYETIVFPNGKDNKIDSIFVDLDTTATADKAPEEPEEPEEE